MQNNYLVRQATNDSLKHCFRSSSYDKKVNYFYDRVVTDDTNQVVIVIAKGYKESYPVNDLKFNEYNYR